MATSSMHVSSNKGDAQNAIKSCKRLCDEVYQLYLPERGSITLDIILFHGFHLEHCEDAYIRSWRREEGPSSCSLDTLLAQAFPQARILAVSYDACITQTSRNGRLDMYTIGENLAQSVIQLAHVGKNSPVVLVGHCVGGIVLKVLCLKADQLAASSEKDNGIQWYPYGHFLRNLRGVFFYSTAHSGSPIFQRGESKGKGLLVEYWESLNSDVCRINSDFANLRRHHGWKAAAVREANETDISAIKQWSNPWKRFFGTPRNEVVTEEASGRNDIDAGFFSTISGEDYASICRPKDRMSMSFQRLENFLNIIHTEEEEEIAQQRRFLQQPLVLVDMAERTAEVIKMLKLEDEKTSWLGLQIVGMGGIGKSTLAKQVLQTIGCFFEYAWFVEVGKKSLSSAARERSVGENFSLGSRRRVRVHSVEELWLLSRRSKVLLVLDDIQSDHEEQINLFLQPDSLGDGSRVIVTSRIQREMLGFVKYPVPFLSQAGARELFQAHVNILVILAMPTGLVDEIVRKCDGLPLTVKVIGSYLRNENAQAKWKCALNKLSAAESVDGDANDRLWKKLRVSYDDLGKPEQERFLDLASFDLDGSATGQYDVEVFRSAWRPTSIGMSEEVDVELQNLEDRSLIRIISRFPWDTDGTEKVVDIHEQLRDMGKSISRPLSVPPRSCRGLWRQDDAKSLLTLCKTGIVITNSNVEVLSVEMSRTIQSSPCSQPGENDQVLPWDSLHELENLRLLRMSNVRMTASTRTPRFPSGLTLLHMIQCSEVPLERWSLQSSLRWNREKWPIRDEDVEALHKLAVLHLDNCSCVRLPKNVHKLRNLKIFRLDAPDLLRLPDKFCLPNLQSLHLECAQLEKLPSSFLQLRSLKTLTIKGCSALKAWPIPNPSANVPQELCHLTSLTRLTLEGLSSLAGLPDSFGRLSSLKTLRIENCSALKILPEGFGELKGLKTLMIRDCAALEAWSIPNRGANVPQELCHLTSLTWLSLEGLSTLVGLPDSFGKMSSLEVLHIKNCSALKTLPEGFGELKGLKEVRIVDCARLDSLCESFGNLDSLEKLTLCRLRPLRTLPRSMESLRSLKRLHLQEIPYLTTFSANIFDIQTLAELQIRFCTGLEDLGRGGQQNLTASQASNLRRIRFEQCPSLRFLPESLGRCRALTSLVAVDCGNLECLPESLGELKALKELHLQECNRIKHLPWSTGELRALEELILHSCKTMEVLPVIVSQLTALHSLSLYPTTGASTGMIGTGDLDDAQQYAPLGDLKALTTLYIHRCAVIPESLFQLTGLRNLSIRGKMGDIPDSLSKLRSLQCLYIGRCNSIPMSLSQLNSLNELKIIFRTDGSLPESLGYLRSLTRLGCINVSGVPESLGQLSALKSLKLKGGAVAASVPQSLGHLRSLTELECINTSRIPESLGQLSALIELKCINVSGIPESLGQLSALESLTLTGGAVAASISQSWGRFQLQRELGCTLESLTTLTSGAVAAGVPQSLGHLRSLIILTCINVSGIPESLGQLSALESLKLIGGAVAASVPQSLGHLRSLTELECINMSGIPESLGQLSALKSLTLTGGVVAASVPQSLGRLRSLTRLECINMNRIPESLWQLSALQELILAGGAVPQSLGHLWSLKALGCTNMSGTPESLGELLPKLRELHILDSKDEQRWFDMMLSGQTMSLRTLNFSKCENLRSLSTFRSLKDVYILDCSRFERVPNSVGKLNSLEIRNCPKFTGLPDSFEKLGYYAFDEDTQIHTWYKHDTRSKPLPLLSRYISCDIW